jgi:hypothetical protein
LEGASGRRSRGCRPLWAEDLDEPAGLAVIADVASWTAPYDDDFDGLADLFVAAPTDEAIRVYWAGRAAGRPYLADAVFD